MSPTNQALQYLINSLMSLYISAYILRVALQIARADFYHPLSQFVVRITNPLIVPIRRIVPGFFGMDWAAIIVIVMLNAIKGWMLYWTAGVILPFFAGIQLAIVLSINGIIDFYFYTLILMSILSWIAPQNPFYALSYQIVQPLLRSFQKVIPPIAGFDIAPIFAIIALQLFQILLMGQLIP